MAGLDTWDIGSTNASSQKVGEIVKICGERLDKAETILKAIE